MDEGKVAYQEEVTRGELRHAMRGYNAMGYPPAGYVPAGGGMVTIIIMAAPNTTIPDWRGGAFQPHAHAARQAWPAFDWRQWVRLLCVVAIVASIGYIVYGMAFDGAGQTSAGRTAERTMAERTQQAADDLRTWLADLLPDAAPKGEPVVEPAPWWRFWDREPDVVQPQDDSGGWTWPPANPVGDAIDGTMQIVTWLVYAVIILAVLWIVSIVAGAAGKFRGK